MAYSRTTSLTGSSCFRGFAGLTDRHRREHFDLQSPTGAILRRIQENAAKDYGQDWEEGVGGDAWLLMATPG